MIFIAIVSYFLIIIAVGFFLVWYKGGSYDIENIEGFCLGVEYLPEDGELNVALLLTAISFKF